jgi:hypothetical protein
MNRWSCYLQRIKDNISIMVVKVRSEEQCVGARRDARTQTDAREEKGGRTGGGPPFLPLSPSHLFINNADENNRDNRAFLK